MGGEPDEAEAARLADSMVAFYEADIAAATALYPGCRRALDGLAAEGARLGLCTNKREGLARELLRALGILDHFHGLAGADTYAYRKPDPRHLLAVIEQAGGTPARALMVGDTAADIGAAKAAGVRSIAVAFGYSPVPAEQLGADAILNHYDELLPLARNFLIGQKGV
jgi:phosphoglycolate phosphatase